MGTPQISSWVQYALLMAGMLLIGYGLGGAPPLRWRVSRIDWMLAAIIGLALFLRLWDQGVTQRYLLDELHFSDALLALESHSSVQILQPISVESPFTWVYVLWQSAAVSLFGHSFFGFRFASAAIGTLTVLAAYGLARELFDRKTALLAALVLATFPPHVHFSRTAIIQIADPFAGTLALWLAARALRTNRRLDWAFAGVALGFTQYFYEGGKLLFPPLVIGFLLLVALRGGMRGKWRGFALLLIAAVLVGAPVYGTLLANHRVLFGRYDVSGLSGQQLGANGVQPLIQHLLTPFELLVARPEMAVYYGGGQALVLEYLVPVFLIGCFYLVWRYPAPAFVIPLWIAATALGNGLLRDSLVSSRYEEVLPALALAMAAGVRYLWAFFEPKWSLLRGAVPVMAVGAIALGQVDYYFGVHLPYFTTQVRDAKPYRDAVDAAMRTLDLPGNTQVYVVSKPPADQVVTRNWLNFVSRDADASRYFPLLTVTPDTLSPKYLLSLPRGVNYAFFVDPNDGDAIAQILRYFPGASPPQYSRWNIPADKEYLLFFVPSDRIPERPPPKSK